MRRIIKVDDSDDTDDGAEAHNKVGLLQKLGQIPNGRFLVMWVVVAVTTWRSRHRVWRETGNVGRGDCDIELS